MKPSRRSLLWLNVLGGIAVLGSYVHGLASNPLTRGAVWGDIPDALRPLYTVNMLLAAAGYFAFSFFVYYRLDPARKPGAIDFQIENRGAVGIYEFAGARLRLCMTEGDTPRPTEFRVKEKEILMVLERVPAGAPKEQDPVPAPNREVLALRQQVAGSQLGHLPGSDEHRRLVLEMIEDLTRELDGG